MSDGPVAALIREKLTVAFAPARIELEDDSWKHAGHHHEGGIDLFEGQGRLARQRAVNAVLKDELAGPVHALSIRAQTVEEAEAQTA